MKKRLLIALSIAMLTLTGCAAEKFQPQSENTVTAESDKLEAVQTLTYSLMSDETTKNEIKQLMKENNIPDEAIERFFKSVDQFNELMGDMKGGTNGFETISYSEELFDYDYIGTTWMKELKFDDQQCRLTTFNLLKDVIKMSGETFVEDTNHSLSGDLEIQKTNPNVDFTEDELKRFENLYTEIAVQEDLESEALAQTIQTEWTKRGISFDSEVKASLMSVFLNWPKDKVTFVGHAGIVLEAADGYVLVEKLGQYSPYVASKFKTLDEMKSYLVSTYEVYCQQGMSDPLIFVNDNWLK